MKPAGGLLEAWKDTEGMNEVSRRYRRGFLAARHRVRQAGRGAPVRGAAVIRARAVRLAALGTPYESLVVSCRRTSRPIVSLAG
jgi:hypothetical protein